MNKKRLLLIIPIILILLSVHLFSRFRSIEDNLRYQYGTPLASIEVVDKDHKLVIFSMADTLGLTKYNQVLGFYDVKDDYGHTRVKDDVYVVLSDRGLEDLVLWGSVDVDVDDAQFIFTKDEQEVMLDVLFENQYFCETIKSSLKIDSSWALSLNYKVDGTVHQIKDIIIEKDY